MHEAAHACVGLVGGLPITHARLVRDSDGVLLGGYASGGAPIAVEDFPAPADPGDRASGAEPRRPLAVGASAPPSSPGSGEWAIQVGAFGDAPSAEKLADRLEGKGYPVEVLPAGADSNRWRVRVQPIAAERSARSTSAG